MRIRGVLLMLAVLAGLSGCGGKAPAAVAQQQPSSAAPSVTEASPPVTEASSAPAPSATASPSPIVVPAGVTAGIAVFDRKTGTFLSQVNPTTQFRSASLVK